MEYRMEKSAFLVLILTNHPTSLFSDQDILFVPEQALRDRALYSLFHRGPQNPSSAYWPRKSCPSWWSAKHNDKLMFCILLLLTNPELSRAFIVLLSLHYSFVYLAIDFVVGCLFSFGLHALLNDLARLTNKTVPFRMRTFSRISLGFHYDCYYCYNYRFGRTKQYSYFINVLQYCYYYYLLRN